MAYTTINDPTIYFNTKIYAGNSSTQSLTGIGFQPDWVWIKNRSDSRKHNLYDSVRGATKRIVSNSTVAEDTAGNGLTSFDSDGFTTGSEQDTNHSGNNFVAWNWLAGGSASSNSNGSITSSVSANTTAGFSIVTYTGTGSSATVGHSLGAVPKMFITKKRNTSESWGVYHHTQGAGKFLRLESQNAVDTSSTVWDNTTPTSSVFSIGTGGISNTSGGTYVAYCFAEKQGYSKFGSWTGVDGVFIYTGFKPAFIFGKNASNGSAYDWWIFDNKRDTFNDGANNLLLRPNGTDAEATFTFAKIDFLSNGFKIYGTDLTVNGSGDTMIYMAFAESPFVTSTGIPTTSR